MDADVLIVGQGVSGTMLSWFLHQQKISFVVIDEERPNSASRVAAGMINPVTGRRYSLTWMIDDVLPWAKKTYAELSDFFDTSFIQHKNIIDFFPSAQMQDSFVKRVTEANPYLRTFPDQNRFNDYFNYSYGCGEICPAYVVNLSSLLHQWRCFISETGRLIEQPFQAAQLQLKDDGVQYGSITAKHIVFCDGIEGLQNPWFQSLPYSANKGESLLLKVDLPRENIYKKSMVLAPVDEDLFWFGATYAWDFKDDLPSAEFLNRSKAYLAEWLKVPFEIIEHKAAIRPATLERRPFVGFHPSHPRVGLLNGMGTKGISLAPYFAHQLVQHILYKTAITDAADVQRFHRILTR